MMDPALHLGIDLGSVSLKVVLIDSDDKILFERWTRVAGAPIDRLLKIFAELHAAHSDVKISSVGVTGSGRNLIADVIDARLVNEISAHSAAAAKFHPEIRTIIEIGGQDSKLVILNDDGAIRDFRMNELCAAGTGAFLDQQAMRLGLSIENFAALAEDAKSPAPIAGRCAVFAKTDMTHHQQEGRSLPDIVAGLNEALVRSYMANLVRGKDLPGPVAFQGGVASNRCLVETFRRMLRLGPDDLIVPKNHLTMGAIGASLIASDGIVKDGITIKHLIDAFDEKNKNDNATERGSAKLLSRTTSPPLEPPFKNLGLDGNYLGIDVGSVSVKLVILGPEELVFSDYRFSDGRPLELLQTMLREMEEKLGPQDFSGVGITGSGRNFLGKLICADTIHNEITSQIRSAAFIMPDVDTVMEIGGQDAKFMRIDNGRATHFEMNRVCAAGTGAFLQEQANRLKIDIEGEFSKMAFESKSPADLGARCTVFMESDLVSHQQMGFSKCDLVAGLSHSVITNYLEKVVSGHPMGNRILFLGGVAENPAIVSALESKLETKVEISRAGKISGAIGAGLLAFDEKRNGKFTRSGFSPSITDIKFEQSYCEDCPNRCLITKTSGPSLVASRQSPAQTPRTFGGRCGKWEDSPRQRRSVAKSYLKRRLDLLDGTSNSVASRQSPVAKSRCRRLETVNRRRVGIPRALITFDMLPAWRTFFEELGCAVILSPATNKELTEEGFKHLVVETCLPVKVFCAHIHWFQNRDDIDYIFVPSLVFTGEDNYDCNTSHCPYIQSLVQFARPISEKPILNPVINWKWHPDDEARTMVEIAEQLGVPGKKARKAWQKACEVQAKFRADLRTMGDEVISDLDNGKLKRAFVVLGKDYNIGDATLNSNTISILESRGETVITQDMITDDSGNYSSGYKQMIWTHGKEILAAVEIAARTPGLYPILITSFGCGPDSFTINSTEDIAGDKPILVLEVDEHSSSVGMETRIEAFLDSLPEPGCTSNVEPRQAISPKERIGKIYLPNFSDHGYAFAATFRTLGFEPVLTDLPDDESLHLGSKHSTSGECHPYTLMLGDYIKAAGSGDDFSNACYFIPDSGLCRAGQFGAQMRRIAEKEKLRLPIFTSLEEILHSNPVSKGASRIDALVVYWEMMRGMDFLSQKFFETRSYEVTKGDTDRAHAKAKNVLMERILENRPHDGLIEAISFLESVVTDKTKPRIKIGITGDYYTRICDYANSDIFRDIERMGGVVMLPPTMCEFIKYDSYQKPTWAFHHRQPANFLQHMISRRVIRKKEEKIRNLFGDGLDYGIPLEYHRAVKYLEPYMDMKLPSGLTSSTAAILDQIHSGADGILNLITFHCTYGLILSSVLASIDKDYPDLPKLTLIFEGLKPTHNKMRIEAFMERIKSKP